MSGVQAENQIVGRRKTVDVPKEPSKKGYSFTGWYTDSECTNPYDFNTPVTGNITLYAGWKENSSGDKEVDGFALKKNNNNWYHASFKDAGFEGKKDYGFISDKYYKALIDNEPDYIISSLKKGISGRWGGSCYGIAVTMGLLYHGKHSIDQYSDSNASCYFELPKPVNDNKFMDTINYYQVSNTICNSFNQSIFRSLASDSGLANFLKNLCNEAKKVVAFYVASPSGQSAHAILAVGGEDKEDGSHVVKFYDMNSYEEDTKGEFDYMLISPDYTSFTFESTTYSEITEKNYTILGYYDWDEMKKLPDSVTESADTVGSEVQIMAVSDGHATLSIKGNTKITNSKGESFVYEDGLLSGTMKKYDINPIASDDESRIEVEVDDSEYFTLEGSVQDVSVGSSKGYMSVEGSGFDGVTLSYEDGVKMKGENYSFKAFVQTDNTIEGKEKGLASVSGNCTGESVVKKDGDNVKATTTGEFKDIVTTNYVGIKKGEETISGIVTEVTVDTKRATDDGPDDPDDPDNLDNPDNPKNKESDKPIITVSDNQPMDYSVEERGGFKITYNHSIPFYGKAKPVPGFFGEMTVSYNDATYVVSKIKVNKKKKTIQITGLSGADKTVNKEIKKATKGSSGLQFSINPYYVRNDDPVDVKLKKDDTAKSIIITLKNKKYKVKKEEYDYDKDKKLITFKGNNLAGSYIIP